jgi:hypothetical protein
MTPTRRWAALLWVTAAGALFAAVLLAALAYGNHGYGRYLDEQGLTTPATVIDVGATAVTVEFADYRGTRSVAQVRWWPPDYPTRDDRVEITYDPWDPRDAVRAGSPQYQVLAVLFTVGVGYSLSVAIGSTAGALLVHRARRRS